MLEDQHSSLPVHPGVWGCQVRYMQRPYPHTLELQKDACRGSGRTGIIAPLAEVQLPEPLTQGQQTYLILKTSAKILLTRRVIQNKDNFTGPVCSAQASGHWWSWNPAATYLTSPSPAAHPPCDRLYQLLRGPVGFDFLQFPACGKLCPQIVRPPVTHHHKDTVLIS